jgi:hypothetical protein
MERLKKNVYKLIGQDGRLKKDAEAEEGISLLPAQMPERPAAATAQG